MDQKKIDTIGRVMIGIGALGGMVLGVLAGILLGSDILAYLLGGFGCPLGVWISVRLHDMIYGKQIKELEKERKITAFYEECKKYGIQDLKKLDAAGKQRVQLIAEKHKVDLSDPKVIQDFNAVRGRKEKEAAEEREKKALADKQKDQEQYEKLTRYAQLHGNKKPVAMFRDMAGRLRGDDTPHFLPTQKESDGMFMAGIASGIGGTAPALASLSRTAQNNEAVRAQNQATHDINMMLFQAQMEADERARKYEQEADKMAVKLVSDAPGKKVFQYLKFDRVQTKVTAAGSITVEAEAAVEGKVTAFDKPGFIDGYVIAELYDGSKKMGEAKLVFPAFGSINFEMTDKGYLRTNPGRSVKLEGICLFCGKQGKTYTVKMAPGDLWIMER